MNGSTDAPARPSAALPHLFKTMNTRFPLWFSLVAFGLWQVLRLALWLSHAPPGASPRDTMLLFLAGVHLDAVWALVGSAILLAVSAFAATLLAALPCLVLRVFGLRLWHPARRLLFRAAVTVGCMTGVFLVLSEWYFFDEFDSRFNTVAIDYLIYPHEVFTNLRESYPLPWIGLVCVIGGAAISYAGFTRFSPQLAGQPVRARFKLAGIMAGITILAPFSVLDIETAFSRQRVINELANNGWASAARAAWSRNLDYTAFYPTLDRREAFVRARNLLTDPDTVFLAPEPPAAPAKDTDEMPWLRAARDSLVREISGDPARPKLNVCIITEESMGSEFWGCLGRTVDGRPHTLTPRMDAIATQEGLLFTHLLADGNRTIRGLEAIYSSFPPLPGDSILARDQTQNVETIARLLKRDGYSTLFFYAGRGSFDHVKSYTLSNGWDRLVDESDFERPVFRNAWGVSDEDLLQRGIVEMRAMHLTGRPFLATFMTVSNHRPFTYPEGRIPESPGQRRRDHAVKYADWALGDFFDRARHEPFWRNTVFVVVADHGARVYGSQTIPLKSYQIPLVVVAPALITEPRRIDIVGSQLDVAPTLLGLVGRPYRSLFFGHDLLKEDAASRVRCLMHHNRSIAVFHAQHPVVFGLNKTIEYWQGSASSAAMSRATEANVLFSSVRDDGIALFQVADDLYTHGLFCLPPDTPPLLPPRTPLDSTPTNQPPPKQP